MSENNSFVSSCLSFSPIYVLEADTLLRAVEAMKRFKVEAITVINKDSLITGSLTKQKIKNLLKRNFHKSSSLLKNFKVKDILCKNNFPVVFYPGMNIGDAFSVMKCLNSACIPVVNEPWEKKMVGVLKMEDVLSVMKKLPA